MLNENGNFAAVKVAYTMLLLNSAIAIMKR